MQLKQLETQLKSKTMEELFSKLNLSIYFIESTSFEYHCLYQKHQLDWCENLTSLSIVIGHINNDENMPINVSFRTVMFKNKQICFYNVESRFNDSVMVENYIKETFEFGENITDANNFHNVIQYINCLN